MHTLDKIDKKIQSLLPPDKQDNIDCIRAVRVYHRAAGIDEYQKFWSLYDYGWKCMKWGKKTYIAVNYILLPLIIVGFSILMSELLGRKATNYMVGAVAGLGISSIITLIIYLKIKTHVVDLVPVDDMLT